MSETSAEVLIEVETKADFVGCRACGTQAESQDRTAVVEACHQVGANARPVAGLARELGVCWRTVMEAVKEHGTALVNDPSRVGLVTSLGVDETSYLKATATHSTLYATGLVDLDRPMTIDMIEGNRAVDLRRWRESQNPWWLADLDQGSAPTQYLRCQAVAQAMRAYWGDTRSTAGSARGVAHHRRRDGPHWCRLTIRVRSRRRGPRLVAQSRLCGSSDFSRV